MLSARKERTILMLEYGGVLAGFLLMYLFVLPQMDVFLLARYVDSSLQGAIDFSLHYGNGRLLGNVIGIYVANHFEFATLVVAVALTVIVFLLNGILLKHNRYTVFPVALFVAFPSIGFVQECYYTFACFTNYVIPAVFLLSGIYMQIKLEKMGATMTPAKRVIVNATGFFSTMCACLFSENTTILVVLAAMAMPAVLYICRKKQSAYLWINMCAAIVGAVVMYLIPVVTGTSGNLAGYRQIASGISDIVLQCVYSYCIFADILNHMHLLLFLFSFAMILLCCKQKRGPVFLKQLQKIVFAAYPFLCLAMNQFDTHGILADTTILKLVDAALVCAYAVNIVLTVALVEDKSLRWICLIMSAVTILTVAPMMIVNASGNRTYYTTFICMTVFAVVLIRWCIPDSLLKLVKESSFQKVSAGIAVGCFAVLSAMFLMLSLYNYDFYVLRCNDMAETFAANEQLQSEEVQQAPMLPFAPSSMESFDKNAVFLSFDRNSAIETELIDLSAWDQYEFFRNEIVKNPIYAVKFAFENWCYKDPEYPDTLCP